MLSEINQLSVQATQQINPESVFKKPI